MTPVARGCLAAVLGLAMTVATIAQEPKSATLAAELAAALDAAKLDAIAAKDPSQPDAFVGALYFSGAQLLVVSARYAVPQLLDERLMKKEYRDVYLDLSSASIPESKIFIEDGGANGLRARREENRPFDTYEAGGKRTMFNNDWRAQKLSEDEYTSTFSAADTRYAAMLTALLEQLKKP
ncbi:MAG: hypothetical protein WBD07_18010 [Vicinamibacterales bacterium]